MFPDPPTVSVDKLYLSHNTSITLELVCAVESNPSSQPHWVHMDEGGVVRNIYAGVRKNTRVVERGVGREMVSVVVINSPQDTHAGEYLCRAENILGEDRKGVVLKGNNLLYLLCFLQIFTIVLTYKSYLLVKKYNAHDLLKLSCIQGYPLHLTRQAHHSVPPPPQSGAWPPVCLLYAVLFSVT